jgi:hypothetical protein
MTQTYMGGKLALRPLNQQPEINTSIDTTANKYIYLDGTDYVHI